MNWEEWITGLGIGRIYHDVNLGRCDKLPERLIKYGIEWIDKTPKPSLLLTGVPGSGKTHFMVALLRALWERKIYALFVRSADLDRALLSASREDKGDGSVIMKYAEAPIIFIDDLGVERESERMQRQLYDIIDRRVANSLPTVVSSNYPREKVSSDARIVSRLECAYELKFPSKDLRKAMG